MDGRTHIVQRLLEVGRRGVRAGGILHIVGHDGLIPHIANTGGSVIDYIKFELRLVMIVIPSRYRCDELRYRRRCVGAVVAVG